MELHHFTPVCVLGVGVCPQIVYLRSLATGEFWGTFWVMRRCRDMAIRQWEGFAGYEWSQLFAWYDTFLVGYIKTFILIIYL